MGNFTNKIDFTVLVMVKNANPNGDPLNGNRPRETYDGYGEISDVCIKRKIRNRLQDMGEHIFVQSDERTTDEFKSLADRANGNGEIQKALKAKDKDAYAKAACDAWIDVRSFGQVFAFKGDSVSVGVRGPVSVHSAFSVCPVAIDSMQITKSVNSETKEKKSSDTMGMKHTVCSALYVIKGSINHQLAEKTGFSDEDAEKIKEALRTLFVNDSSSARPDGSMEVCKVYWWKHNCPMGQYSSAKVHKSVKITAKTDDPKDFEDYEIKLESLDGLALEELEGI
ncbi:MAG: type I-C CRISPR-associated protein Cas7/Csd2 [Lachnospiraceae bacterium]|jgi:CRISPR-associated protein Cas7/Csd2, subtype I-C/DVULG|nr:type I-C CRISPR-associated protein Cas7/Csd2 [Lachnospiraceae bacterium]MCI9400610.1 type I-C CRISPR-associated protein Cas7/Csd2 [Lachnospiraceae bacterium]MCX4378058.1 type I-C CRISPR-associated protein Cas7/Csd2 [Lachnospiraceae bacterium]